jgi:hypothetical protein
MRRTVFVLVLAASLLYLQRPLAQADPGETLHLAPYVVVFVDTESAASPNWTATANSGAIFEARRGRVAEPNSMLLLGVGLTGLSFLGSKRKKR